MCDVIFLSITWRVVNLLFSVQRMAVLLVSFILTVRGVHFYDVSVSAVSGSERLVLQLETTNRYDSNCVAVHLKSSPFFSNMFGHLAREDAAYLAPLLQSGLSATG